MQNFPFVTHPSLNREILQNKARKRDNGLLSVIFLPYGILKELYYYKGKYVQNLYVDIRNRLGKMRKTIFFEEDNSVKSKFNFINYVLGLPLPKEKGKKMKKDNNNAMTVDLRVHF